MIRWSWVPDAEQVRGLLKQQCLPGSSASFWIDLFVFCTFFIVFTICVAYGPGCALVFRLCGEGSTLLFIYGLASEEEDWCVVTERGNARSHKRDERGRKATGPMHTAAVESYNFQCLLAIV